MIPETPVNPEGEVVSPDRTGYAVTTGNLRIGEDFFELDLSAEEAQVTRQAIYWDDDTPSILAEPVSSKRPGAQGWKGHTFVGDYPALDMLVDALKRYENQEAGIGEDKMAYDARTAFNHSRISVQEELRQ